MCVAWSWKIYWELKTSVALWMISVWDNNIVVYFIIAIQEKWWYNGLEPKRNWKDWIFIFQFRMEFGIFSIRWGLIFGIRWLNFILCVGVETTACKHSTSTSRVVDTRSNLKSHQFHQFCYPFDSSQENGTISIGSKNIDNFRHRSRLPCIYGQSVDCLLRVLFKLHFK